REEWMAAEHLEAADVRPVVDLRGRKHVAAPVPREKGDGHAVEDPGDVGVRRPSERSLEPLLAGLFQLRQGIDTAASDQADPRGTGAHARTPPAVRRWRVTASRTSEARASAARPVSPSTRSR